MGVSGGGAVTPAELNGRVSSRSGVICDVTFGKPLCEAAGVEFHGRGHAVSDKVLARLEALEAEMEQLRESLVAAQGEALYAGQIAPLVLSAVTAHGEALSRERARELVDLALLHFEEAQARMPGVRAAIRYACDRFTATLGTLTEPERADAKLSVAG